MIQVFFHASEPSTESSTLTIADNATNSPQTAALTGIGTITPIEIYPIMANFGSIQVGSSSTIPVVLATNWPLTIQQITTSGSVYSETNHCGSSLAAGARCAVSVRFTPSQQGRGTGTLSMALNGKPAVAEVKLVGSGQERIRAVHIVHRLGSWYGLQAAPVRLSHTRNSCSHLC